MLIDGDVNDNGERMRKERVKLSSSFKERKEKA
jgi:hypothetical protein